MTKGIPVQDPYLHALRNERVPVSAYLVNGIKLQGRIESFDQFVVLLRNSVSQMVYKHAISTVVPSRNVRLGQRDASQDKSAPLPRTAQLTRRNQSGQDGAWSLRHCGAVPSNLNSAPTALKFAPTTSFWAP